MTKAKFVRDHQPLEPHVTVGYLSGHPRVPSSRGPSHALTGEGAGALPTRKERSMDTNEPLFTVSGVKFFEHPTRGDESPLLYEEADGVYRASPWWDRPTADEVDEWLNQLPLPLVLTERAHDLPPWEA